MRKLLIAPLAAALTILVAALPMLVASPGLAATVTLNPSADNTLYHGNLDADPTGTMEDNSCGGGPDVFSGVTLRDFIRRAVLSFDVAGAIPAGSTIDAVTLTLNSNLSPDTQNIDATLHPISKDWGEGIVDCQLSGGGKGLEADPGDATWLDAKFQQVPWTTAGGDFGSFSALASIPPLGAAVWDGTGNPAMLSDVQSWLDTPAGNHGWILLADETRSNVTRRFDSREGLIPPVLQIDFTPAPTLFACCADDGDCTLDDAAGCSASDGTLDTGTNSCQPNPCAQPIGACCNIEETCSDPIARDVCEDAGGEFQGAASACTDVQVDCGLEPFTDALPIPPVLQPFATNHKGYPAYDLTVVTASQQLHSELPATELWTYNGTFPGPTIEAEVGMPIEVVYRNGLPLETAHALAVDECPHGPNHWQDTARVVTHLHGGHVPSRFDGQPEFHMMPGELDAYEYLNEQLPTTLWYHDHAMGITRLNVYMGLAGFYLLRDAFENGLGLPSGEFEIPALLQDRQINPDGSLYYPETLVDAFFGDKILVNGKVWPYLDVKQGKYRLRFLNGSQARVYTLRLENLSAPAQIIPFQLIGTDGGLIGAPISLDTITLTPAERLDVVIDFAGFSAGTEIVLRNDDEREPRVPNAMKFVVGAAAGHTASLPVSLRPVVPIPEAAASVTRNLQVILTSDACAGEKWLFRSVDANFNHLGERWDDLAEFPILGETEIWEIINASNMMHPFHMHLVMFQVLDRTDALTSAPLPLEPWESNTWKDTVAIPPRTIVRVIATFEDYPGRYAYHCHILDHEDYEMMRQFQAVNDSANCNFDSVCDADEDCVSCSADCAQVSGALCGNGLCEIGDGEDCVSCPADCAGDQSGGPLFCCGDGDGIAPVANCGMDVDGFTVLDDRCTTEGFFCRISPRLSACCGDTLCEGQESVSGPNSCDVDCIPLPEPGRLPMFAAGVALLTLLGRRRAIAANA
jgi:spore coat protein A